MAGNIKGITIELQGNIQPLEQALKKANTVAKSTASEMRQVDKALKFNPASIELITQKQTLLTKQIENTKEKLTTLKNAQAEVEEQFKAGKIGEENYRAFKRELETTESTLTHYKTQLTNLSKEQDNLGKATDRLSKFFSATGKDIEAYRHVLGDKLTDSIKNGKASSKDMEKALELMAKEASNGKADVNSLREALDKLDDGGSIQNVKKELEGVGEVSQNSAEKTNKLLSQGNLQQASQVASQAGQSMLEFGKNTQEAFRNVDSGFDIIITKTGATTDEALEGFKKIYDQLAVDLPVDSFEKIGSAIGEVNTQFGLTDDALQEASRSIIQFAEINDSDITASTINAKKTIEAYGLSASDLSSTLDTVTYVAQGTGVSVDELFSKMVSGAPQIKELGLSFDEAATLIGSLEKAGVDSGAALSSMSKAAVAYAKDGKTLSQGLQETIDKIKNASSSTQALTEAANVFGTKGATRMVDAIKRGAFSLKNLAGIAEDAGGTVAQTFEATLDPIDKQQQKFNAVQLALAEIGASIAEAIAPIMDVAIPAVKQLADWFKSLPDPIKQFIVVLGGILAVVAILSPVIVALGIAITTLGASMLPIVAIIGAVAGGIAIVTAIVTNFGSIVEWLEEMFPGLGSTVDSVWNGIQNIIQTVISSVSTFIQNIFGSLVAWWEENQQRIQQVVETVWNVISTIIQTVLTFLAPFIQGIFEAILTYIQTVWTVITTVIQGALDVILGIVQAVLQVLTGDWSGAWDTLSNVVSTVLSTISSTISSIMGGIASIISGIWEGILATTSSIWEGIKGAISGAIDGAASAVGSAIEAIKGFFNFQISWPHIPLPHFSISGSPNPLDWLSGGLPSIGIEWYAKGGIMTKPTIFGQNGNNLMVGGEAGNEAILPLNDRTLSGIGRGIASHLDGFGGVNINIYPHELIVRNDEDVMELATKLAEEIIRKMKMKERHAERARGVIL
ncbi:phage tail tape measure protein [Granulicatella adiacens]|uniref:phage tail tape measure protein n=1 Tax=Granulicatella adiacens TaxID=46124 RepID=UPI003C744335